MFWKYIKMKKWRQELDAEMKVINKKKDRLKEMDFFVLDNSLRETTVGQMRGHTLENKWEIYEQVKRIGFSDILIAAFNHQTRVADTFIKQLKERGEDMTKFWAFSEFIEECDENRVPKEDIIPIGLIKCKELGIPNVMMEFDLDYYGIDYNVFTMDRLCKLMVKRFKWIRENISPKSKICINIRDFTKCMTEKPELVLQIVTFISTLPKNERIFGLATEDMGDYWHDEMGLWASTVRKVMDKSGWSDGHFIVHVHERFGLCMAVNMEFLANGATGIWAGICDEGANLGHASSCLTIMNLVRMGNKKVLERYNCANLRSASRKVTEIVTTKPPHPRQPISGDRAIDLVFGLEDVMCTEDKFNLVEFFGESYGIRISTMATPQMVLLEKIKTRFVYNYFDLLVIPFIVLLVRTRLKSISKLLAVGMTVPISQDSHIGFTSGFLEWKVKTLQVKQKLENYFGENENFTIEIASAMKELILEDLHVNRKEEYNSAVGLALLFDRAGGKLTGVMSDAIEKEKINSPFMERLIGEVRAMWDEWDLKDGVMDDELDFFAFYNGFMAPYFSCYRCDETMKALKCIDMDNDGTVDWKEFAVYLKWAANQYPEIKTAQELLDVAFRKGILPAMQDEIIKEYQK